ncbi:MAG: hypothetical protein WD871_06130 [Xanthobacteraceae bacterium]
MDTNVAARFAAGMVATMLLIVPALWNGFPLLFYDTGAYLGRAFFDTLSPGRSAAYGFFLGAGRWPNFWPVVIAQSFISVWTVALFLRAENLGGRPVLLVVLFAIFAATTSLPWLAGQLMPDVFTGLSVLALYLLVFRADALARWEHMALTALIAFAAAGHNATLAVLLVLLLAGVAVRLFRPQLMPSIGLARVTAALVLGAALLLAANFAVTGRILWTQGGTALVFSRLVQNGIVHRFLADNCPNPQYELCKYRAQLPHHANDFLWHQGDKGPFAAIGSFDGGAQEMREIAWQSVWQYPGMHISTALRSTLEQLFAVGTGWGVVYDVWDAYGHIENLTPEAVPAAHSARQRLDQLPFETINRLHVPVAWLSMAAVALFLLLAWLRRDFARLSPLAATTGAALLANAFVCGALSNPHDRYGARIVWIATLLLAVAVARALPVARRVRHIPAGQVLVRPELPVLPSEIAPGEIPAPPQRAPIDG